jgi:DNA-binding response OmpR family regulator
MPSDYRPRILYVEDDEDSREMLSALLKFSHIEATTVATAAQAYGLIKTGCFDLYLLDTSLPDVDGFELCRVIRGSEPDTPILFFSGAAYEVDKRKGMEAGANAYLVKPDIEGLVGSIKAFVFPEVIPDLFPEELVAA